ncbi:hypothetical protein MMC25_006977 [Agyrium rufum]|nr:hypothetical protein [Agyrium rufum]
MSNIKVSIQWDKAAFFAGEEVGCTITFRNDAHTASQRSQSPFSQAHNRRSPRDPAEHGRTNRLDTTKPQSLSRSTAARTPTLTEESQEDGIAALSIARPIASAHPTGVVLDSPSTSQSNGNKKKHQRSVSIVSIPGPSDQHEYSTIGSRTPRSPIPYDSRRHFRASSYQGFPSVAGSRLVRDQLRSTAGPPTPTSAIHRPLPVRSQTLKSAISDLLPSQAESAVDHDGRVMTIPGIPKEYGITERNSQISNIHDTHGLQDSEADGSTTTLRGPESTPTAHLTYSQKAGSMTFRALSPSAVEDTPRTSMDIHSGSNNSTETLASEYIGPASGRLLARPSHRRQNSHLSPVASHSSRSRTTETLMMGYVQLMGSFVLDASLVNVSPFEDVKRKGIIGGQGGGGVVGVEKSKRDSGLFGSLGWSNIGESIGGLIGTAEPSSIRQMKGAAKSRSIPLLSTPQAILFIDLQIKPGESKGYRYSYFMPRGLPPSHKGRAMKVNYNLVIGTQRAQYNSSQQHLLRHVEIPFRVLPCVHETGEILGHDLFHPHIILRNQARTQSIPNAGIEGEGPTSGDSGMELLSYVYQLLDRPRANYGLGLLSPTDERARIFSQDMLPRVSVKEIIDRIILRGSAWSDIGPNKYHISRGGEAVGTILISRPAFRLGETIPITVDFTIANVPCHSVHVFLETFETVDPSIALRSSQSIRRATRKIYASQCEFAVCQYRAFFNPTIPLTATPSFYTSGLNLEWRLHFEFICTVSGIEDSLVNGLMEEIGQDERGRVLAAIEGLPCESFEVDVPIRVYGSLATREDSLEQDEYSI